MKINTKTLLSCGALALLSMGSSLLARADQMRANTPLAAAQMSANKNLAWTEWELVSPTYAGLEKPPFLKFSDDKLSASVGLNSIGGTYALKGRAISVTYLLSTRMAGPQPLMTAEDRYSKALQSARSYELSADGKRLTLRGDQTLIFRLTARTPRGFVASETKIVNVAPQLGPSLDGDKTPKYLQLEDLSEGVSWGRFSEAKIEGFRFVPGYRFQMRVLVERDARSGEKRLRLLEVFSQHWMPAAKLEANHKILEVAPTKVRQGGREFLQVREVAGRWMTLRQPINGFSFQDGWRYRLQVAVTPGKNPSAALNYRLVRVLDMMPVTF